MARPKSTDPKQPVTLSLRASTVARIAERLGPGETVGGVLSTAVEAKFGGGTPAAARAPASGIRKRSSTVTPRPKGSTR